MTSRASTRSSSGLGSVTIMGYFLRLLLLFSTCVAFSLVASMSTWRGAAVNWSTFVWCFCFFMTLIILIVELFGLQSRLHLSWNSFLITCACYATLFCLSASIIFAITYIQLFPRSASQVQAIATIAFSCIASMAYATEVAWIWAMTGDLPCYLFTLPDLFKRLEIFVTCVIFAFISSPYQYLHRPALVWCVAMYAICFLLGAVALLLNWCDCDNRLPIPFSVFQLGLTLLSVLLYTSTVVL
ncbi:myeloid-associated differentiation marker-like [Camelus bactrianus]